MVQIRMNITFILIVTQYTYLRVHKFIHVRILLLEDQPAMASYIISFIIHRYMYMYIDIKGN